MQVCWLDLVLMNSVTKALAATDRYIVLFILGCFIVLHSGLNVKARQSSRGFLMMLVPQKRQPRKVLLLRLENSTTKARSHGLIY